MESTEKKKKLQRPFVPHHYDPPFNLYVTVLTNLGNRWCEITVKVQMSETGLSIRKWT